MNSAAAPDPVEDVQGDGRWMSMHNRFVAECKEREPDVLFLGDSLIAMLAHTDMWEKCFAPMHALNFGIGGDRTENVLWRVENGEVENISPKAIVLQVGTNNHGHMAEEIASGIEAVVVSLREKQPQAYLVVLMLLPRGENPNPVRERNAEVNRLLGRALKSYSHTQLVNTDPGFVQQDGTISHRDMYDYLHLTRQGYWKAFEPVHELLSQLLAESDPPATDTPGTDEKSE